VIYTHLDPAEADDSILSTLDFFRERGDSFEWKLYDHDLPGDMRERLGAHGFVPDELESVLALDLEAVPPEFWQPSSVQVERLSETAELEHVARIATEAFGEEFGALKAMLATEMRETPAAISIYTAHADGQPASSAWIRFYPGRQFAELYGGATIPSQRGRGLYTALVRTRAAEARERGVRFLVVDTSPMSRPILEKQGFVFLTHAQGFVKKFEDAPIRSDAGT
jgi:GNAT superfamily N-acetyltransferase